MAGHLDQNDVLDHHQMPLPLSVLDAGVYHRRCWQQCFDFPYRMCVRMPLHAGYAGHASDELLASLKVTRYQSSKAALTFAEYSNSCSRLGVSDVQQLLLQGSSTGGNGKASSGRLRLAFAPN